MARYVEGSDRQQVTLLPECLDDYIAEDNPVRVVLAYVSELDLEALGFEGMTPAATGRPAYHPSVLLKIYIYGYLNRIASSRRLERECQRNVELMWLTGRLAPDFKTIADFRRNSGAAIRRACRQFIVLCRDLKLFSQAVVAIDGSKFKAVNSRDRNFTAGKIDGRIRQIEESISRYLDALETADRTQAPDAEAKTDRLQEKIAGLRKRMRELEDLKADLAQREDPQILTTDPDARSMTSDGKTTGVVGYNVQAEAVENAVKIARYATGRPGVIAFAGAFHGRTLMGMALTGKVAPYKLGFGPFPSDVYHVPFPSELQGVGVADSLKAIEQLFKADIDPRRVAAIIIEPVQGEGGFNVAPAALLEGLRAICDEHGIMMIADEIQTGFGRTGKLFAMEHSGVQPDLVTMAKSLSGGLPLSAVCGRAKVMDAPAPGGLGGTYAANPLAVAAAHAVFDTIEKEQLVQRSARLGSQLRAFLQEQRKDLPMIADVRGLGSMSAVEFREADGTPSAAMAQRVQQIALKRGLILLTCGVYANVIRFLYPLTIPQEQFDAALEVIGEAMREAALAPAVA